MVNAQGDHDRASRPETLAQIEPMKETLDLWCDRS